MITGDQQYTFLGRLDWKLYIATLRETGIGYDISYAVYEIFKLSLLNKAHHDRGWIFQGITFSVAELADMFFEEGTDDE